MRYILPFDGFIERLKTCGFVIGTDHYLRLHRLLHFMEADTDPLRLKYLLCPVFATDSAQQQVFCREFDLYFSFLNSPEKQQIPVSKDQAEEEKTEPVWARKGFYILTGILVLALTALFFHLFYVPGDGKKTQVKVESGTVEVVQPDKEKKQIKILKVSMEMQPESVPEPDFYQKYGRILRWYGMFAPFLVLVLAEIYRHSRRKLVLLKQRDRKPPYSWQIRMETRECPFFRTQQFYDTARRLRQRLAGDIFRPDVHKTLSATVRSGGFPEIRYRAVTRPPEYLMLIDLPEFRDHYARFMDSLASALERQDIFLDRYFYKDDPQVCFREVSGKREYLNDLKTKYSSRRLILFGTGENLLNPESGEPEKWTELFRHWPEKALLTPKPVGEWGLQEVTLAADFLVLPASLAGLNALAGFFETGFEPDVKKFSQKHDSVSVSDERLNETSCLRAVLGEEVFQWLCACAVYPELHWNLTLHLGLVTGFPLTEENLFRLIRLPWFREGNMPDELRLELIRELDREKLGKIRKTILDILEKNPPPEQSAAWDTWQMHLALHARDLPRKDRKRFLKQQKTRDWGRETQILQDYTLLRVLYSAGLSPLGQMIPKRLHKLFFRHGIPFFGMNFSIRLLAAAAVSAAVFWLAPLPQAAVPDPGSVHTLTMEFAYIEPGTFMMGSPEKEAGRYDDESPQHQVTISKGFYLQTTEVTQRQWKAVMGNNPSYFKDCDDCPVENVSWEDAQAFIKKLNQKEGKEVYRLPTEAQWEYAARAGTDTAYCFGDNAEKLKDYAWYDGNSGNKTHPVAQLASNAWGLYDMHGNVWEWCADDWHDNYDAAPADGRAWIDTPRGPRRVYRGGSWFGDARNCRSACRHPGPPGRRGDSLGFRVQRS